MSRFQVQPVDGSGGGTPNGSNGSNGGIDNPALDPVELNVYGLYTKRNSMTCPVPGELKRKSSYGFTHITRLFQYSKQTNHQSFHRLASFKLSVWHLVEMHSRPN